MNQLAEVSLPTSDVANARTKVSTLVEVANFFGVSVFTVRKDWVRAGMPGKRGSYPLEAIAAWKRARPFDHQSGPIIGPIVVRKEAV